MDTNLVQKTRTCSGTEDKDGAGHVTEITKERGVIMEKIRFQQQGDVIIEPISLRGIKMPKGKKMTQKDSRGYLLALGEVTGHAHALEEIEGVEVIEAPQKILVLRNGREEQEEVRYFIRITNKNGAVLRHEEHNAQTIPPGEYVVRGVREYDHFAEEARRVID